MRLGLLGLGRIGTDAASATRPRSFAGPWHQSGPPRPMVCGPIARRLRPEPGQAGQIVSVNDDVMESDGHIDSMRGTMNRNPRTGALLTAGVWHLGAAEGGIQRADSALAGDDVGIDDIAVEARGLD